MLTRHWPRRSIADHPRFASAMQSEPEMQSSTDIDARTAIGPRPPRHCNGGHPQLAGPSLVRAKTSYPKGCSTGETRLRYHASQFPIVEVDSSVDAMPTPSNAALWVERTPAAFIFNNNAFHFSTGHQTPPKDFPPRHPGPRSRRIGTTARQGAAPADQQSSAVPRCLRRRPVRVRDLTALECDRHRARGGVAPLSMPTTP